MHILKNATQRYSTEFWTSLTKDFPLVKEADSQVTRISKQREVVTSWHIGHETKQTQDKYGFSSSYRNSKYDKVLIGVPAEVLLGLDNQRRFKPSESFVTTNTVGMKVYKWNGKEKLISKVDLPQYGFMLPTEGMTRHWATNTTNRLTL